MEQESMKVPDWDDVLEFVINGAWVVFAIVVYLVFYFAAIMICGRGVEQIIGWFGISIDSRIYWTGVGLLILFCAFGKTTVKNENNSMV